MLQFNWKFAVVIAQVVAVVTFFGCGGPAGPPTEPVTGTVTLDGKPAEGVNVVFSPTGGHKAASGITDASGRYQLTTLNPKDGAMVGSYTVAISKTQGDTVTVNVEGLSPEEATKKSAEAYYSSNAFKNTGKPSAAQESKELVPVKYKDPATSGFTAEVKAGQENKFDFQLISGE